VGAGPRGIVDPEIVRARVPRRETRLDVRREWELERALVRGIRRCRDRHEERLADVGGVLVGGFDVSLDRRR
jgi:hypothetical protein